MKTVKSAVFTIVTGVAVVIQLMNPVTVYADDKTTPPPAETSISTVEPVDPPKDFAPTESPTVDPVETSISISTQQETVEPPSDIAEASSTPVPEEWVTETPTRERTPKPPETTTSTPEPTATTSPTETVAVKLPALLESVQAISSDTSVVVLDANGQPEPLVTQAAADAIANSDPMWCPASDTTVTANCINANTVAQLIPMLLGATGPGVIYFTVSYTTNDVVFDGNNPNLAGLTDLTLQGGWNGNTTLGSTITFSGNSVFSVPITISNWNNNVTVNNITVDGVAISTPPFPAGLKIDTTQNVAINNSTFSNNAGSGARISANNVTINNSTFSGNSDNGAVIGSVDATISNSTFNGNSGAGAYIFADNVTISNSTFSNNIPNGASVFYGNYAIINNSSFTGNHIGLQGNPDNLTLNCVHYQDNNQDEDFSSSPGAINITRIPCPGPVEPVMIQLPQLIIVPPDQDSIEVPLDCSQYSSFLVVWSNGDQFLISCVAGGVVRISRADNTALTNDLPAGYEYAAAYNVEIFQHGVSLPVVPAGGFIRASFASRHENPQYGIMVWDEKVNNWTLLQEYQKDPSGASVIFPLDPSNPQDERKILKGTRFITTEDPDREEVTTNFTGTFVLVQQ